MNQVRELLLNQDLKLDKNIIENIKYGAIYSTYNDNKYITSRDIGESHGITTYKIGSDVPNVFNPNEQKQLERLLLKNNIVFYKNIVKETYIIEKIS